MIRRCIVIYLSDSNFRLFIPDNLEILSEKRSELRGKCIKFTEELLAGTSKLFKRVVILIVKHLAFEEFPEALN